MPETLLRSTLSRRLVLGAGAALAAPALLSGRALAAETCVVGTWGGDYARLLRENIDDPILKPEGVRVVQDVGDETPRYTKLVAQRALPHSTQDISCLGSINGYRANAAGLVADLTEKQVPNMKYIMPELRMPGFIPHIYSAQVILYNPNSVSAPPQSMKDLLDPKWKGKIGLQNASLQWLMAAASLVTTGTTTDFAKAKEFMLKLNANNPRLYPQTDDFATGFKSGEITVGMIWLARDFMWANAGVPVKATYPTEGSILYVSGMVMPKNAPHRDAAYKYMNALLEPAAQQGFAAHMGYQPTVTNAPLTGNVGAQLALPTPRPKLVAVDYKALSDATAELNDWWLKNIQHS